MVLKLEYQVDEPDDRTCVWRLRGNLVGSVQGYAFQDEVRTRVAAGLRRVVVDLSAVERIDSSGIGILVATMWSTSSAGGKLVLAALPPAVERVLSIAMLMPHIAHAGTVQEALAKLDAV